MTAPAGANAPRKAKPKAKGADPVPGVDVGDHVYVRHPSRGPIAVKVLAHGKHGLTGECDKGERHRIRWDGYMGTKARMLQRYRVVDQGADGMLLEDEGGRRRFLEGDVPLAEPGPASPDGKESRQIGDSNRKDDPIIGGMDRLTKAESIMFPEDGQVLFLKAQGQAVANRPGLALKAVTDKAGHQTKRWSKSNPDQPKGRDGPAPLRHGDVAFFRHGDVMGHGRIAGSGQDGVTLRDHEGAVHQVRHEHLLPADDKAGASDAKPKAGKQPAGDGKDKEAPADKADLKGYQEGVKKNLYGGASGDPVAPPGPDKAPAEENPPPLFDAAAIKDVPAKAAQPVKDEAGLYELAPEALEQLQEWLDRGKGIASKMGIETMAKGMDGVDWSKPGGMLFIGKVKGRERAAEKVASDYGGDWSQLLDPVRCSIAVDSFDEVQSTLKGLLESGMKLARQPKDRFNKPLPAGYRDLMLNVTLPNGMIGEVQLHVKPMLQAKEEGHKHYEVERRLTAKGEENWDDADRAAVEESHKAQMEIYSAAWRTATGGAGKDQPAEMMAKAMSMAAEASAWNFLDHDGAKFRRRADKVGWAVDDVLHGDEWKPYQGDRLHAGMFGDAIEDPMGGGAAEDQADKPMAKALAPAVLFFKAIIPGGAGGDLFAEKVQVHGHMRDGTYVAPHTATRLKAAPIALIPKGNTKNFTVASPAGEHLGSVRAGDHDAAMKVATSLYGNRFGSDPGIKVTQASAEEAPKVVAEHSEIAQNFPAASAAPSPTGMSGPKLEAEMPMQRDLIAKLEQFREYQIEADARGALRDAWMAGGQDGPRPPSINKIPRPDGIAVVSDRDMFVTPEHIQQAIDWLRNSSYVDPQAIKEIGWSVERHTRDGILNAVDMVREVHRIGMYGKHAGII